MVRVMKPPLVTEVRGVNTRTGFMAAPATPPEVMDVKVIPVTATVSNPVDNVVSALVESMKPVATIARGAPRVSPVRVMVIAEVPVSTTAVVSTMVVLEAVTAPEVAVNVATLLAMEDTRPKK
jgi:hypothetical protein